MRGGTGTGDGEGQLVARIPAVDHKQCSGPSVCSLDDALEYYCATVRYHMPMKKSVVKPHGKSRIQKKTCAGAEPRQAEHGNVSEFAVVCMHVLDNVSLCALPSVSFPHP